MDTMTTNPFDAFCALAPPGAVDCVDNDAFRGEVYIGDNMSVAIDAHKRTLKVTTMLTINVKDDTVFDLEFSARSKLIVPMYTLFQKKWDTFSAPNSLTV